MTERNSPSYCDGIIPGPWWNSLTYEVSEVCPRGARIKAPVGKTMRYGVVESCFPSLPKGEKYILRKAQAVPDGRPLLTEGEMDLIQWTGRTFLCSRGEILKIAVPPSVLSSSTPLFGASQCLSPKIANAESRYRENFLFDCRREWRWEKLVESLEAGGGFLALFSEQLLATAFFNLLPPSLKESSLLWPPTGGKRLSSAWMAVRTGEVSGVVGGPGAVFAPLKNLASVIVEEESSGAYRTYRRPFLNMRTIAARRARLEKAALTLSGRLPSSRVYLRGKPKCPQRPPRGAVKFVDLTDTFSPEFQGISGGLPLSQSLFAGTEKTLASGRSALWLLDRKGYAAEVACEDCGNALHCSSCGRVMAWEEKKGRLRCSGCGKISSLPSSCPVCRGTILAGKRPGLEALLPVARGIIPDHERVFIWDGSKGASKKSVTALQKALAGGGIVLGTRAALALCDLTDVGFAAWIDADSEVRGVAYGAKFTAYSMMWESLWRGPSSSDRVVLIQSRRPGSGWQKAMVRGWDDFWGQELKERKELGLPPFSFLMEIRSPSLKVKDSIISMLEEKGLPPMDPGDPPLTLWTTASSPEAVQKTVAPLFSIGNSKVGFPEITLWLD